MMTTKYKLEYQQMILPQEDAGMVLMIPLSKLFLAQQGFELR